MFCKTGLFVYLMPTYECILCVFFSSEHGVFTFCKAYPIVLLVV